jgi:hypothetical protein
MAFAEGNGARQDLPRKIISYCEFGGAGEQKQRSFSGSSRHDPKVSGTSRFAARSHH